MLIVGAKGLATELLEVCKNSNNLQNLAFYDNINNEVDLLYNEFPILHNDKEVLSCFIKKLLLKANVKWWVLKNVKKGFFYQFPHCPEVPSLP